MNRTHHITLNTTSKSVAVLTLSLGLISASTASAAGDFDIQLNYINTPTEAQAELFSNAEATWESIIVDYKDNVPLSQKLTIDVYLLPIDGKGGTLGLAGSTSQFTASGGTYVYSDTGVMQFDTADLDSLDATAFSNVILHEMAHVIGIGSALWVANGLYTDGTDQYTGANALAAYNAEFGQTGTFVPVETDFGDGTAFSHWNENTEITEVSAPHRTASQMLMTGLLSGGDFISKTTIGSFEDLGYNTVPEPSSLALLGLGGLIFARRRG